MTTTRERAVTAAVTGAATTVYYALPDVVRSRTARGWARAACLGAIAATCVPDVREGWDELRATWREPGTDGTMTPGAKATVAVAAAATIAGVAAAAVAGERWIFRRGEARAAAGVRFAHTRTALVLGVLSAAVALVPEPSEHRSTRTS